MPFNAKSGRFSAKINVVEAGTGDKAMRLGGENVLPFYTFDAPVENAPKTGIEITDGGPEAEPSCIRKLYEGCVTVTDMAKKAVTFDGVDFLCIHLEGADPNTLNRPADELAGIVKDVAEAVDVPIAVRGCQNAEKDSELLSKCAKVLKGRNAIILSAREENYETVGKAAALSCSLITGAESAVDINLAKQLNILLAQLSVDGERIVMDAGSAAAGYGIDYLISTLDRIKSAAFTQNDTTLQMPVITAVSTEAWTVKESTASEEDMPEWGDQENRGIDMEIETAAAVLAAGSDAVILRHPESVRAVKAMIRALI